MDTLSVPVSSSIYKSKYYGGGAKITLKKICGFTDVFGELQYAWTRIAGEKPVVIFTMGSKNIF